MLEEGIGHAHRKILLIRLTLLAALLWHAGSPAQTLARRNWAGSGLAVEPWWNHAVLYQVDPLLFQDSDGDGFGDLHGLTLRLDYVQSLGPDAALLSPFPLPAPDAPAGISGSGAALDELLSEAGRRHLRILVDLPADAPDPLALAHYWLTRGVAGFRLVSPAPPDALLDALRRLLRSYPGDRVLVNDLPGAAPPGPGAGAPVLLQDNTLATADTLNEPLLRSLFAGGQPHSGARGSRPPLRSVAAQTVLAADLPGLVRSWTRLCANPPPQRDAVARLLATALLTAPAGASLLFGQELGMGGQPGPMQWGFLSLPGSSPETSGFSSARSWVGVPSDSAGYTAAAEQQDAGSLLNFYRALIALHHGNAALAGSSSELLRLPQPGVIAALRRPVHPAGEGSSVVVLLNLTSAPVTVQLRPALQRAGVHNTRLKVLLRSSTPPAEAPETADSVDMLVLQPLSSLVGEVDAPGLETQPQTTRSRRHR